VDCVPKLAFLVAYLTAQRKSQDQTIFGQSDFETIICEIRRQTTEMKGSVRIYVVCTSITGNLAKSGCAA
jgi:hypothetical protein